jgi:hypothetical protein
MRPFPIAAVVVMLASSTALAQTAPESSARFDGDRLVTISCPSNTERSAALGYKLQFPARVSERRIGNFEFVRRWNARQETTW